MADQGFQERTEKATGRRRRKAREEGQVAKSMELNSAAILLLGFLSIYMMGPFLAKEAMHIMRYTMANAPQIAQADVTFVKVISDYLIKFLILLSPIFIVVAVVAFGVNVTQVGFMVTTKSIEPKLEKLDMIKGLKKFVSLKSLVQLVRDSIKLFIVGFVAYKVIEGEFQSFFLLPDMSVSQLATRMGKLALVLSLKIGAVILIIAVLDYLYQRYEFEKSIRMSKQEIKDEYKDTEGSPQIKSRVRQIQREMARSRMMKAVPLADVVVTNPTHLAVALKYDQAEMKAPYVLAKGERLIAERIKKLAEEHDIPIVEDKPLARALFKMCDIGQMIPANLYRAVAELLAYVYKTKGKVLS
ncbi:MAG: flagellar biosynthesis protein FlhB [FCB group bacterium]|nr:flagellar biosynthesis protein FlhB [FCB group bacterium]